MNRFSFLLMIPIVTFGASFAKGEIIYGVTNLNNLVTFDSGSPSVISLVSLQGFSNGGETIDSIDVRPATGQLYGFSSTNTLYTIDPITGISTQVGSSIPTMGTGRLTSIDFNPTVDRIRVLESSNTPNNFRINPNNGTLVLADGNVTFGAGDVNAGDTPNIVAAAYTNSIAGATVTTLYGIETGNDVLVTQIPANDGVLQTVGPLGINFGDNAGFTAFDISGQTGTAYLVGNTVSFLEPGNLNPPVANRLYLVNLNNGSTTAAGDIGLIGQQIKGLAVAGVTSVPEPSSILATAVGLIAFGLSRFKKEKNCSREQQL